MSYLPKLGFEKTPNKTVKDFTKTQPSFFSKFA